VSTRGRFLVVDDDDVALEVAKERLESAGFSVVTRNRAFGTLGYIWKETPQYVLLDVQMPGLSGDAIAKLIAEGNAAIGIILHSAVHKHDLASLGYHAGALGIIEKTDDDQFFRIQLERCVRFKR
jgi:two-component system OmpR family response regulator